MRSSIPVTLSLFLLAAFATPASASGITVHGRGLHAEAALYAGALGDGRRAVQILDRLCANPEAQRRCEPIRPALERAITRAADRPIAWVHRLDRHAGDFWVLAPIRFGTDSAKFGWAWRDPRPFGCFGGGQLRYRRINGAWKLDWGIGYEGCPASTG